MATPHHAALDWCRSCSCPEFEPSATHAGCDLCTHHPAWHLTPLTLSPEQVDAAVAAGRLALERCKQEGCACPVWVAKAGEEALGAKAECELCGHKRGWHKAKNLGQELHSLEPSASSSPALAASSPAREARSSSLATSHSSFSALPSPAFDRPPSTTSTAPTSPGHTSPNMLASVPLAHSLFNRHVSDRACRVLPTVESPPFTPASLFYCPPPQANALQVPAQPVSPLSASSAGMRELTENLSDWMDRMNVNDSRVRPRVRPPPLDRHARTDSDTAPAMAWGAPVEDADDVPDVDLDGIPVELGFGRTVTMDGLGWPTGALSDRSAAASPELYRRTSIAPTIASSTSSGLHNVRGPLSPRLTLVEPSALVRVTLASAAASTASNADDVWFKVDTPANAKLDLYVSPPPSARLPVNPGQKIRFRLRLHSHKPPAGLVVAFVGNSTVVTSEHRDSHDFVAVKRSILPSRSPGIDLDLTKGEYTGTLMVPSRTNCACAAWEQKPVPGSFSVRLAVVSYQFEVRIHKGGVLKKDKDIVVPVLYLVENPSPGARDSLSAMHHSSPYSHANAHTQPPIAASDRLTLVNPIAFSAPPKFSSHFTGPIELAFKLNPASPPEPHARGRAGRPELAPSLSWRMAIPFPASVPKLSALAPLAEATKPFLGQKIVFRSSPAELKPGKQPWGVNCGTAPLANPGEAWVGDAAEVLDNLTGEKRWVWEGGVQARRKDLQVVDLCNLSVTYHLLARLTPKQGFSEAVTLLSPAIDFDEAPATSLMSLGGWDERGSD